MKRMLITAAIAFFSISTTVRTQQTVQPPRTATMASTLHASPQRTTLAGTDDRAYTMLWTGAGGTAPGGTGVLNFLPIAGAVKVDPYFSSGNASNIPTGLKTALYSQRLAASFTLGASVTVKHYDRTYAALNPVHATFRFDLFKLTANNVETLLGSVTEPAVVSTEDGTAAYSATIPNTYAPLTLGAGERFILRPSLVPIPGQTMAASATSIPLFFAGIFNSAESLELIFTETPTFVSDTTRLIYRRTNTIGIGNFFDLLTTTVAQTAATAVVTTTAGGNNIQWTRTAGGTVLEFISPRFTAPWVFDAPDDTIPPAIVNVLAKESATSVNGSILAKVFRRRGSTETLILTNALGTELNSITAQQQLMNVNNTFTVAALKTSFAEDDRLVLRFYAIPATGLTMGAGSETISYDSSNNASNSYVDIFDAPMTPFKAETDPPASPSIRDGMNTLGIQN